MGWLFSPQWAARKDLVRHLTRSEDNETRKSDCLAHCLRGNVLWTVWEITRKPSEDPQKPKGTYRFIGCDLLQNGRDEGWGYKDMDESAHPYYYSCPLKYLDMVPTVTCQEWRDKVIERHNIRSIPLEAGLLVGLAEGFTINVVQVIRKLNKEHFVGKSRDGKEFKVKRNQLSGKTFETWPDKEAVC